MKNLYLYLTGIALLASGAEMVSRFAGDTLQNHEWVTQKDKQILAVAPSTEKIPYARVRKTQKGTRMMLIPSITATNTYVISNDTGLSGGSAGDELTYTVTITNGGTDANGVSFTETLDPNTTLVPGSVTASPIAVNDSYNTIGNVGLDIPAGSGLLSNDISPAGTALTITGSTTITTAQGGTVTVNASNGAFVYDAPAGYTGNDTFNYTITNNSGATSTATATIVATGAIWFINDNAPGGGTGTLSKPFNTISQFQLINDNGNLHAKTGHTIFLYSGAYSGSFTLLSNQKLIGEGSGSDLLTIGPFAQPSGTNLLPVLGGTRPDITSSANAITVNTGNTIRGLNVGNTTNSKINGSFTNSSLFIREAALTGSGRALSISGATLDAEFSEVSSTSTSGGAAVTVALTTGGTLKIATGSINATNNGAIAISGTSLALTASFVSVSSSGTAKGIAISGTTGTFQITGTGTTGGSGGTIQNISARGIELSGVAGVTIKNMNLNNANTAEGTLPASQVNTGANAAIYALNVNGLTLDRVVISGTIVQEGINMNGVKDFTFTNGSVASSGSVGDPVQASQEGCIYAINTSGTCKISSVTFTYGAGRAVYFDNTNTNLDQLSVISSSFSASNAGLQMYARGTSKMKLRVTNSTFTNCGTSGVEAYSTDTGELQADVLTNNITQSSVGTAVDIGAAGNSTAKFNVNGNTASTRNGPGLNFYGTGNGYLEGNVNGNNLTKVAQAGSGIRVSTNDAGSHATVNIENNVLNPWSDGAGIVVESVSSTGALTNAIINNNTLPMTGAATALYGIDVVATSAIPNTAKICAKVTNNKVTPNTTPSFNGYSARFRAGVNTTPPTVAQILMQGTGSTTEQVWIAGGNTPTTPSAPAPAVTNQSGAGTFTFGPGVTCASASVPLLPTLRMSAEEPEVARIAAEQDSTEGATEEQTAQAATIVEEAVEPAKQEAPAVTASPARTEATQAGETINVNGTGSGFNIPAGKNVVIKFKATINNNIPTSVCQVSTQGTVTGTNFSPVLTDDPNTAGSSNPTVTPVTSVPVITFCPGNQTVSPDAGTCTSTQTFTATADGCPAPTITYSVGGNPITFPYAFPAGNTTVLVTASNGIGTAPTCSFTVTVTPTPAPPITDQPDAATICAGSGTSFTVATSQTGVTYQWQKKPFGGSFSNITTGTNPTADDATLTLSNVPASDNLSEYRCIITNPCNNTTSDAAVLTVNQITGSSVAGTTTVNQGASAPNVTFGATGGTLPYTFTYKINNGSNQTVSTTGVNTTANVSQPTTTVGVFTYELVSVTDAQNCTLTPPSAQTATVTVANNLTATISGSTTACENETEPVITFTAVNGIAPFTFTYKINGGTDQQVTTTGANTTATVNVPTSATGTFVYSLTNVSGAGGATTPIAGQTATVNVNVKPTIALTGAEYQCDFVADPQTYTVFFTATPGAVITTDKGTVNGSTVTGIPSKETALIVATLNGCSDTLTAFKDCSMPVTLIDFSGAKVENTIALKWNTAEETNSDHFDVQRSADGKSWATIGAQKSRGESFAEVNYGFVDKKPASGDNYYRLKMVDADQTFAYSKIIKVGFDNAALLSEFYPNPVSDILNLKSTDWSQVKSVELHSLTGLSVYRSGKAIAKTIDVKNLPVGMYILTITHKNGEVVNRKVLINR
ncbi:Por secretion system C-terminal sorting domain-containing protein [Dyadobacter sp. SG02]|uniref:Ig-like domain-containing protein n=1 Tax=Dyadobacter sp. SG02 TaxID=1855291 RepID=UPI0008C51EE4|nr:Ig-like domain-containing protein [Dyadobacter sp. SG02]SEJ01519.1 Por secretion system C-terminal sorting domain-containing protein [Dyadobacter sp. SG02]